MVWERTDELAQERVAPLNLRDWTQRSRTFDAIGGYIPGVGGMVMSGDGDTAETVPRQWVTSGIFDALGVRADRRPHVPALGRSCSGANVVVLSRGVLANALQRGSAAWSGG